MEAYRDSDFEALFNQNDYGLCNSPFDFNDLPDGTGDVVVPVQLGEDNDNGTTTNNFNRDREASQPEAELGVPYQESSTVVPIICPTYMEFDFSEPVEPSFGFHPDDHAASSSHHLQSPWQYEAGGTLADYTHDVSEQPLLEEGLSSENLEPCNAIDTPLASRGLLTMPIQESHSFRSSNAPAPTIQMAVVKSAVLKLVPHHKRSAHEKSIGSGHLVQRLTQMDSRVKKPRAKKQTKVADAPPKRVPCVLCKFNHRSCSGGQPCDRCNMALLRSQNTPLQEKPLMHTSCIYFNFEPHNVFIEECTYDKNLLGPFKEARKRRTLALDCYVCIKDMFTAFQDESLRKHFCRMRRIAAIATSECDAASYWWSNFDLHQSESAVHVLFTTYLLLDRPVVQKVFPDIDAGMVRALHAHASQRLFEFLEACLCRRRLWLDGFPISKLPYVCTMLAYLLLALTSVDRQPASAPVTHQPDLRSQEQYLDFLIQVWGPHIPWMNIRFMIANTLSAKKAALKKRERGLLVEGELPALDGSTLSKHISGVPYTVLESFPLVPPDYMRHLAISSEDIIYVLSRVGHIQFTGRDRGKQYRDYAFVSRAYIITVSSTVAEHMAKTWGSNPTHTSDDVRIEQLSSILRCMIPFALGIVMSPERISSSWGRLVGNPRFRCGMSVLASTEGKPLLVKLHVHDIGFRDFFSGALSGVSFDDSQASSCC